MSFPIASKAVTAVVFTSLCFCCAVQAAKKDLQIYFIDVEGGQATLFVSPSGESLLVDAGWPYNGFRDANRIVAAARNAKVKRIDYLLVTHFHTDHVGGVSQLVAKMPVGTFFDHGPNREETNTGAHLYADYQAAVGSTHRVTVKPGDKIPIKGLDVTVVSADGNLLHRGGEKNEACSGVARRADDPTENARSVGVIIQFGSFRAVDMGDLTWNKELDLMCPDNPLGRVNVLITSHHGSELSSSPALVHALHPLVAVTDNGAKKGGAAETFDTLKSSPGIADIWQLHFADAAGGEHNAPDPFLANVFEADTGNYLKLTASEDGGFVMFNPRNKYQKEYAPR